MGTLVAGSGAGAPFDLSIRETQVQEARRFLPALLWDILPVLDVVSAQHFSAGEV